LTKITKKFLFDHPDIIVTKADKGNVTVSLDRTDYLNKMHDLLSDRETYVAVNCDPTKKITAQLKDLLQRWRRNDYISIGTYRSLLNTDGILPRAYGLPKIHKNDCPLRIIISSINSPLYSLAAFVHDILFKNLTFPNSHIENRFALIKKLNNMFLDDYYDLISLDVVSLFTNVPLDLVIGGIAKRWHLIKNKISIPYNEFLISLKLIMDSAYFQFDNTIYRQIFATPMGSPLSPILANIIMSDLEDRAISSLPVSLPFYVRYVDDIVLAAPRQHIPLILNVFNSFYNRLRFTIEYSNNNSINFLDTTIIINNNYIEFNWYRKPTFSGRFLSFFSNRPLSHKKGVIIGFTDRVFKLSHPRFHNENFSFISNVRFRVREMYG